MQGATAFGKHDAAAATVPRGEAGSSARPSVGPGAGGRSHASERRHRFLYHFLDGFSALVDVFDVESSMRPRPKPVTVRHAAETIGRMLSEAAAEVARDVERGKAAATSNGCDHVPRD
jgi:hypothetical protein